METQNSVIESTTLRLIDVITNWPEVMSTHASGDIEMSFGVLEVTPQVADRLLQTQVNNRKPSPPRVLDYSRRMESGEWTISDALKFDGDGHLIDGQHRLAAVRKSGIASIFPVIAGYPSESQSVIDIGMNRTVAQIGQIQGLNVSTHHVSMVRALYLPMSNAGHMTSLSSPQKILRLLAQHRESIEFAMKARGGHSGCQNIRYAPVRAIVARAWYHENRKRLEEFLYVFDSGFSEGTKDSAAVCLRNMYMAIVKNNRTGGGVGVRIDFAKRTVSALEAFLAGEERKSVKIKSTCKWKMEGVDS